MSFLRLLLLSFVVLGLAACANRPADQEFELLPAEDNRALGSRAYAASDFRAARRYLSRHISTLDEDEQDIEARLMFAESLLELQRYGRSLTAFEQVLMLDPGNPDAREGKALVLIGQGDDEQADELLKDLLAEDSTRWRAWNGRGIAADLRGDYRFASEAYHNAIRHGGDNETIANNLGYSLLMAGDLREASRWLSRAVERYPDSPRLRNNLALALARDQRYNQALQHLKVVLSDHEALNNIGYIAMLNEDYDLAEDFLRRAIAVSPRYYPRAQANLRRVLASREEAAQQVSD